MSFALTDTDQYSALQDVYLKGRIFLDKRPYKDRILLKIRVVFRP